MIAKGSKLQNVDIIFCFYHQEGHIVDTPQFYNDRFTVEEKNVLSHVLKLIIELEAFSCTNSKKREFRKPVDRLENWKQNITLEVR